MNKNFFVKVITVLCVFVIGMSLFLTSCEEEKKTKEPIKIGAIIASTGPIAFLGAPEENTIRMMIDKINEEGGIDGQMIELIFKDSQANNENAIAFAHQLIEEENVFAIIGPTSSGTSMSIKDIVQEGETIMMCCAAAETISDPVASYVFTTPQQDKYAVLQILITMQEMGIKKIALLVGGTGFGRGGLAQFEKFSPDYGIEIILAEEFSVKESDFSALVTKTKATDAEAVVIWSVFPAQSIIPKNMLQIGYDIPTFCSHGFGNIKYVEEMGVEAAEGLMFPCGKLLAPEELPDSDPQKSLLIEYKNDYESTFNEAVSTFGGHAYDSLNILFTAIREVGADKEKVREYIENLKNFPGTGGLYNYSPTNHNGLGLDSLVMYKVENGEFKLLKK
jgi:branched-chain amino acid transport system substrate-binding protein